MSSLHIADIYSALIHNEDTPNLRSPRHPLVVIFQLSFAVGVLVAYTYTARNLGQTILFFVTIGLSLSTVAYHMWRPNRFLRFVDQTMISWFALATPVPFVYHDPYIMLLLGTLALLSVLNKWYEWEPSFEVGSIVFTCLGLISMFLLVTVGLPRIGADLLSFEAQLMYATFVYFILKLIIYHYEIGLIRKLIESPEFGHIVIMVATSHILFLSAIRPV